MSGLRSPGNQIGSQARLCLLKDYLMNCGLAKVHIASLYRIFKHSH